MDLKIQFTAILKNDDWDFASALTDGKLDKKAKSVILQRLKSANLHLEINQCAVDITPENEQANEVLPLVSQQGELLKAYDYFAEMEHCWYLGASDETKDKFLEAFNCG